MSKGSFSTSPKERYLYIKQKNRKAFHKTMDAFPFLDKGGF